LEINWSTFLLEIINFLVLVWILKRFLYRPVLLILEKRRQKIEQSLKEITERQTQALALEKQYQGRLDEWEREKQQLREALQEELQNEKTLKQQQLKTDLSSEREKAAVIAERHQAEMLQQSQQNAHQQSARFAAKLLSAVAGPELESRLFELLLKTLDELDNEHQTTLRNACKTTTDNIIISSAYALSGDQRGQLEQKLRALSKQSVKIIYEQSPQLLAGLRIAVGPWVLRINLQDELSGFVELGYEKTIS